MKDREKGTESSFRGCCAHHPLTPPGRLRTEKVDRSKGSLRKGGMRVNENQNERQTES